MATPSAEEIRRVEIEYPVELLDEMSSEQVQRLAREAFYVRLYQEGKISSGRAGALLSLSRSDFLDLLGRFNVSYFDEDADLAEDLRNAQQAQSSDVSPSGPVVSNTTPLISLGEIGLLEIAHTL